MGRRKTSRLAGLRPNIDGALIAQFGDLLSQYDQLTLTSEQNDACAAAVSLLSSKVEAVDRQIASLSPYLYNAASMILGQWTGGRDGRIDIKKVQAVARGLSGQLVKADVDQQARDEIIYRISGDPTEPRRFRGMNPQMTESIVLILRRVLLRESIDLIVQLMEELYTAIDGANATVRSLLRHYQGGWSGGAGILERSDDPDTAPVLSLYFDDRDGRSPWEIYSDLVAGLAAAKILRKVLLQRAADVVGGSVIRANASFGFME